MPVPTDWTIGRKYHDDGKEKYPLPLPLLTHEENQLLTTPVDEDIMCLAAEPRHIERPFIAYLLDIRLRRFYSILADHGSQESVLDDPYWAKILVAAKHRISGGFNRINVNSDNEKLEFQLLPEARVAWPLRNLEPHPFVPDVPSIPFTYDYTIETCTWN
ncbi:hypothetical protein H0H87_006275 [Tephrocybe sp. NHM501043]|nr:hypothetical protein H0H87_006275 [Tephrocybe sp. NHM501043]